MSESEEKVFGEVEYECVRCGTKVTSTELAQLPEIKCESDKVDLKFLSGGTTSS
jgi:DNA-directed RNA polymerase subunit RPC12/RpoP